MKITALLILRCNPDGSKLVILENASDVSHFGYFTRSIIKEFIVLGSRAVAERTEPGYRMSVPYEARSAFSLLNKVLDEYQKNFGDSWRTVQKDNTQLWPYLKEALTKFQDPAEADRLLKVQRELDETKLILNKTIDSVLARGEKLDNLVEKSSDLSAASRMFYKQAKNTNQCCTIL